MGKVYTRLYTNVYTQNGAKTQPSGAAHTCMAYIREYLPPSPVSDQRTSYLSLSFFSLFPDEDSARTGWEKWKSEFTL